MKTNHNLDMLTNYIQVGSMLNRNSFDYKKDRLNYNDLLSDASPAVRQETMKQMQRSGIMLPFSSQRLNKNKKTVSHYLKRHLSRLQSYFQQYLKMETERIMEIGEKVEKIIRE